MASDAGGGLERARVAAASADGASTNDDRMRTAPFEALVLPYLDDAYNLARWLTRNPQDAEDVVQESFLRALRFFDASKTSNPRAWILTIVRNTFYTSLQATRGLATEPLAGTPTEGPNVELAIERRDPDPDTPETALVRKSDDEAMRALIEALPPPFRETLVLREMEELSYREIAAVTGVPLGTVMSRLARARQVLQVAWTQHQERERAE